MREAHAQGAGLQASVDQLQALLNDLQTLKAAEAAKATTRSHSMQLECHLQAAENVAGLTTQLRQQTLSFAVALRKAQAGSTSLQPVSHLHCWNAEV